MMIGIFDYRVIEINWHSSFEMHANRFPNCFLAFDLHANEILALTWTQSNWIVGDLPWPSRNIVNQTEAC